MNWIKIVAGFLIMMAVVVAWLRIMKEIRGDGGSGMGVAVPKRRKRRSDEGANDLERFIQSHRSGETAPVDPVATAAVPATRAAAPLPRAPAPAGPPLLLTGAHRLVYLVLKTGLPGHHVFARVMLRDLVPASTARADVGAHALAFVVCRSDFSAVAAIELAPLADSTRTDLVRRALLAAGVRHLVVDPAAPPRPAAIKSLIYGT